MKRVKLYSSLEGGNATYVTTAIIPDFQSMPDVLLWGNRVFKKTGLEANPHYVECFAVAVVNHENDEPV